MSVARKANMVPIQMELGGKDACLVLPDADVRLAASAVAKGGFSYSGQRCTAVKLVLAFAEVADELVELVSAKIEALRGPTRGKRRHHRARVEAIGGFRAGFGGGRRREGRVVATAVAARGQPCGPCWWIT